ncbi:hypothetical protein X946_3364 [Burkholderia sp. ABCPW 111]|nr:hypothetical protein X946_3364 [Burkholderia sp. ABCPW 111]
MRGDCWNRFPRPRIYPNLHSHSPSRRLPTCFRVMIRKFVGRRRRGGKTRWVNGLRRNPGGRCGVCYRFMRVVDGGYVCAFFSSLGLRIRNLEPGARRSKVEGRRSKVEGRRSKVEARSSKLEARSSKLEARSSKLDARRSTLDARRSTRGTHRSHPRTISQPTATRAEQSRSTATSVALARRHAECDRAISRRRASRAIEPLIVSPPSPLSALDATAPASEPVRLTIRATRAQSAPSTSNRCVPSRPSCSTRPNSQSRYACIASAALPVPSYGRR